MDNRMSEVFLVFFFTWGIYLKENKKNPFLISEIA